MPIGLDNLADQFRLHGLFFQLPLDTGRGRDEPFDLEFIGMDHEPDHRLLVVRIAADIREDNEPRFIRGRHGQARQDDRGQQSADTHENDVHHFFHHDFFGL